MAMAERTAKHENFRRLAEKRTESVIEAIRKLGNLSSPNYEYEEGEVERIFAAITERLGEAREMFRRDAGSRARFKL